MEAGEGLPFDVLSFVGPKTVRIQTKSTQSDKKGRYTFITSKGRYANKYTHSVSLTRYTLDEVDVVACVALPLERVLFLPVTDIVTDTVSFAAAEFSKSDAAGVSFTAALKDLKII